ncbi:DUF6443 domain-containing protein [Flavobacterium gelatinilyticum]|uniref:DUF6443 domain-containing protein n=1 Tax=Flavobacterium gelatinilyticum TaxID=3003260 RepID=UPI00247FC9A6|nr:DUF6443 domain-containing protein [Flavobacterium gelatinilyticum]
MKNLIKFLLVLFPVMVMSQTQSENYVKTVTYKVPVTQKIVSPSISQASQSTTYFDGLGRPIQKIDGQQSKSGKDIVTHIEYDSLGRQVEDYLPFKAETTNMAFEPSGKAKVMNYYKTASEAVTGNSAMDITDFPFSRKELEASPLNRVLMQAAPGNDWRSGSGHEIKISYQSNAKDEVRLFTASTSWDAVSGLYTISFNNNGFYEANQLYKTVTYDENTAPAVKAGTQEFKNKEGQIVLKRTFDAGIEHDTYYVYDIYGNLTYVIPPKAVDLIGGSSSTQSDVTSTAKVEPAGTLHLTASNSIRLLDGFHAKAGSTFSAVIDANKAILDDLCYQYKYDHRNRLAEKKLPGKQWEFIVYDKLDRVVAAGPANSPFSDLNTAGWIITKYDAFSRPVYTGWSTASPATASGRITLQTAQNSPSLTVLNETKLTSGTLDGIPAYYSNTVSPTSFKLLSVNYYDNYTFPSTPAIAVPAIIETQKVLSASEVKGLQTASWTRVPSASTAVMGETTATFYDDKARPIRIYTINHLGGYTYTDTKLDFPGKTEYTITRHKRLAGDTELKTKDTFTYSPQDRLISQTHQINDVAAPEVLFTNTYDELGQLISKKTGGAVQNINYTYNIRGWLTGINDVTSLTKAGDPKDLFAFKINYNTSTTAGVNPLYNGNIAETYWATNSDNGIIRGYGYRYDNLNRLKTGISKQNGTVNNFFDETLTYDKNGNIMSIARNGNNALQQIDNLVYSYQNSNKSNQLAKVVDNAPAAYKAKGFTDSAANTVDDYSYDADGNMTKDNNKNITAITYNHLNLPLKITFGAAGNIVYLYNTAGQKVQKIVSETGKTAVTTDYLGGYQYDNSALKFFPMTEGYIEPSGSSFRYIYQYKDHLGNIRISYDKTLAIKEESNYYPFGLKQEGYNTVKTGVENKYKYNGKELQDELSLNMYDMDARQYDPAIARWLVHDPIVHHNQSPYSAFNENPVYWADPSGMAGEHYDEKTGTYINSKNETISFEDAMASYGLNPNGSEKSENNESQESSNDSNTNNEYSIKFPKGSDYEKTRPRFTKTVKQLKAYVKSNSNILDWLARYSGFSTMEVLEELEYGKGGTLLTEVIKAKFGTTAPDGTMKVNLKWANGLEIVKNNERLQATSFLVAITILHEFVHYGRMKNKLSESPYEYGDGFEQQIFSPYEMIDNENAYKLLKKYGKGWIFKD